MENGLYAQEKMGDSFVAFDYYDHYNDAKDAYEALIDKDSFEDVMMCLVVRNQDD